MARANDTLRTMQPSIARLNEQMGNNWTCGAAHRDIPPPQSATLDFHTVARKLLLISRPAKNRRLNCPEHTAGKQSESGGSRGNTGARAPPTPHSSITSLKS